MATLSLHLSPHARGTLARILALLGRGSIGAVIRRALALYALRIGALTPDQLRMEAQEIKAHRRTDHG